MRVPQFVGGHKHAAKHMNQAVFPFFHKRMADERNRWQLHLHHVPELAVNLLRISRRGPTTGARQGGGGGASVVLEEATGSPLKLDLVKIEAAFKHGRLSAILKESCSSRDERVAVRAQLREWVLENAVAQQGPSDQHDQSVFRPVDVGSLYYGARTGPQDVGVGTLGVVRQRGGQVRFRAAFEF